MNKRFGATAILVVAVAASAGLLAGTSSGSTKAPRTIGVVLAGYSTETEYVSKGARSAAARFGDRLAIEVADGLRTTTVDAIKSLVSQHAAAIAVQGGSSALAEARQAGIPTLSFEGRYSGSLWVSDSGSAQFVHSLADALASQMKQRGQFVIVSCRAEPRAALSPAVLATWVRQTKEYVRRRYPEMQRVGVVYGPRSGSLQLGPVLRSHPHLRGLDFLCPNDALNDPPQLLDAGEEGKVFSAGNGGGCPPLDVSGDQNSTYQNSVRDGALEVVCARDPSKLAYLAVWAADYLARGHKLIGTPQRRGLRPPQRQLKPSPEQRRNTNEQGTPLDSSRSPVRPRSRRGRTKAGVGACNAQRCAQDDHHGLDPQLSLRPQREIRSARRRDLQDH